MFKNFNYGKNIVNFYLDFDYNENEPLLNQIQILKEDLIQIQYENGFVIDVGWYPEFSEKGTFKIYVMKDSKTFDIKVCKDVSILVKELRRCIDRIQ